MRVGIYARVSTKDQSCDLQLRDLRACCQPHQLVVFVNTLMQANPVPKDRRPQQDLMMADARKRKLDAILVWRFDRFAGKSMEPAGEPRRRHHLLAVYAQKGTQEVPLQQKQNHTITDLGL